MRPFFDYQTLELVITDFCNLDCPLCSQGSPLQKNKMILSINDLQRISRMIKPFEFHTIKISGGEPTLHPQFSEICLRLREMFVAHNYILATNGFNLEESKGYTHVFDEISLTRYPGKNDKVFERLISLKLPNINATTKRDYVEMEDISQQRNLDKTHIYERCIYSKIKKVVGGRIYPCCVIFGQAVRNNIDINMISAPVDKDWRQNLSKINIETYCRNCFVEVADSFWKSLVGSLRTTLLKTAKHLLRHFFKIKQKIFKYR